ALLADLGRYLGGVLTGFEALHLGGDRTIEITEEFVDPATGARSTGDADRVVIGALPLAGNPSQGRGRELKSGHVAGLPGLYHDLDQTSLAECSEQVADPVAGLLDVERPGRSTTPGLLSAQVLTEAAPRREAHGLAVVVLLDRARKQDRRSLEGVRFVLV